ncbi:MAG: hypothetical protein JWM86_685 [Thermoleophilia bacterium]|nr:hypothetical protein [Thermoleophilia bacterium]
MGQRVIGILFFVIGVGLLVGAWIPTRSTLELRRVGDRVSGQVVAIATHRDSDGTTYAPIYAYEVDGAPYRHQADVSSSSRPEVGEEATLLVDPDDPTRVKPATFMGQWFLTALLGGMGATFAIIGLFSAVYAGRSSGSESPPADELPPLGAPDAGARTSGPFAPADDAAPVVPSAPPALPAEPPSGNTGPFL